jgi:hypothetical protein
MVIAYRKSDYGHEDVYILRSYNHLTTFNPNDSSIRNPGPADALEIGMQSPTIVAYILSLSTRNLTVNCRNGCSGYFCSPYLL